MLFADWMQELNTIASKAGHNPNQDWDGWREEFEAGVTAKEAWVKEWGEEES